MNKHEDLIDTFSKMIEIKMSEGKSEEIWERLERSIKNEQPTYPHKRRFYRLGSIGAVGMALLLFIGGIAVLKHQLPQTERTSASSVASASNSKAKTASGSVSQSASQPSDLPLEVVTNNWRLVIFKSLLKQDSYYDAQLFYKGEKPFSPSQLAFAWDGERTETGTTSPIQPGALVSGFTTALFPNGFTNVSPFKVSWSQDGHNYSETLVLSNAKRDLRVENYHELVGGDSKWNVSYAYETIVGQNFSDPYGQLVFTYHGKDIGKELLYTLKSEVGTQQMKYENPQGNVLRLNVDPTEKGYDITGLNAYITIQWQGDTDTIALARTK